MEKMQLKNVKLYMVVLPVSMVILFVGCPSPANAQVAILEVIKAGVKKVIKAVDLKVQRLQNETIWLQNAQKVLETQLSKLKLTEIADWTNRQRELYGKYYESLWKIKSAIALYQRIQEMTEMQISIVSEYKRAWKLFLSDKNFTPEELSLMESVYSGMLDASVKNLDQILLVISPHKTQMTDAKRLEIIAAAADRLEQIYAELKRFNAGNLTLSRQRARENGNLDHIKKLYGINE